MLHVAEHGREHLADIEGSRTKERSQEHPSMEVTNSIKGIATGYKLYTHHLVSYLVTNSITSSCNVHVWFIVWHEMPVYRLLQVIVSTFLLLVEGI